jgi:transposase
MTKPHQPPLPLGKPVEETPERPTSPIRSRGKPIPPETRQTIIELSAHYSDRGIPPRVGLSRKVVRRILKEEGIQCPGRQAQQGKLQPFLTAVTERVKKDLTTTRILREIQEMGYQGGHSILGDLVRRLRAQQPFAHRKKIRCRFETRVAAEMQVDWSLYTVPIGDRATKVHVLGGILAHSRKVHYAVYRNEKQSTLLEGLARAFEYFRGCALRLIFDYVTGNIIEIMCPVSLCGIGTERAQLSCNQRFDLGT